MDSINGIITVWHYQDTFKTIGLSYNVNYQHTLEY